uniref:Uncharacterized protein n=1 Tax=Tanacetum cinerariifolium TaxID=118510 RepID=A0A699IEG4_TANCI|nr:hypothetical protein [Tanacetum cinerariifolium]
MGEGSAIPTDPQHTPTILQLSTSKPQKTQKHRMPKRKDTQVPQLSGPTESVVDEAVYKEMDDSLVRAATTTSSLEAEQDNGGGLGCQDTIWDTFAQTRRVKKLKRRKRSRTHRLKRLYKGRFNDQEDAEILFDVTDDLRVTLAQALAELKHIKPKAKDKGILFHEPEESTTTIATIPKSKSQDKGKEVELQAEFYKEQRLAREKAQKEEEANISLIETWDNVQAKIDVEHQLAERLQSKEQQELNDKEKATLFMKLLEKSRKFFVAKRAEETELVEESSKKAKVEVMEGSLKRAGTELEQENEEWVAIDAIPLAVKPPSIVEWKIHKEGKKSYYQIIRADGGSKLYLVFSLMLKSFDREDVENLWKLVKAKHGSTRPEEGYERVLWGDLKVMFDPYVKDDVWKMQQRYNVMRWTLFNSCGVH